MRDHSLDGLRGVAAFAVVLYHFASALLPNLVPQQSSAVYWITDTPLSVMWNGPYAVMVFFVLSGYVVSGGAAKRRYSVVSNVAWRWVRLGWPAAASAVFAWLLLTLMPDAASALKQTIPHWWLDETYQGNIPSVWVALYEGLVGVFLTRESGFNNVLWSMQVELIGSVFIYLIYGFTEGRVRIGVVVAAGVVALLTKQFYYEGFVTGALLWEFRDRLKPALGWPALAVGLVMGAMFPQISTRLGMPELPSILRLGHQQGVFYILGATALVYAVLVLPPAKAVLQTRPARYLGDISFPMYLVHVPIVYTIGASLYPHVALGWIFAIYLVATFVAATTMLLLVDRPVLSLIKWGRGRHELRWMRQGA